MHPAAALGVTLRAGVIHKNAAHDAGAERKEMSPILPLDVLNVDQSEVGFINERGSLQSVPGILSGEAPAGDLAKLGVHQNDQALEGSRVIGAPSLEQAGYPEFRDRIQSRLRRADSTMDLAAAPLLSVPEN